MFVFKKDSCDIRNKVSAVRHQAESMTKSIKGMLRIRKVTTNTIDQKWNSKSCRQKVEKHLSTY